MAGTAQPVSDPSVLMEKEVGLSEPQRLWAHPKDPD